MSEHPKNTAARLGDNMRDALSLLAEAHILIGGSRQDFIDLACEEAAKAWDKAEGRARGRLDALRTLLDRFRGKP